ncbi:MAG: hypothetical protein ACPHX1_01590 [Porticoccaceae bacterium]
MFLDNRHKQTMVKAEDALVGRDQPIQVTNCHLITQQPIQPPFARNLQPILQWVVSGVPSVAFGSSPVW